MSMRDLYRNYASYMALAMMADPYGEKGIYMPEESRYANYTPDKLSGFTQCKGRKHMSKKKRKQMH